MNTHTDISISSLMTANVTSTTANADLADVIQSMIDNHYSCMIVVENGMPLGIITERDIVRLMGLFISDKPKCPMHISDVMSVPVATISEDTSLFEALVISSAQKIRHMPVVK